ncbi:MAG: hypothetical protein COU63_03105 [Candidatus Pacebacteria bacterium CG10_big_fil_rev_8_21_14_0_10_36_11]|nr:DUF3048 domain-containing protein [Candidatus Pacearchaeota archaeon]OIP74415.1 MAG: hypothetical protein AUK08_01355 [Candidatus Pacebacteria bacterium CG2_30_36_39]PIR64977.1 MAG: hypothetical protein COU63_03105 [Candidatus Pacebacteria bacterium CG10_big_fil_rev_8_21_14_0_10_36_11]PJC42512.1 MAG: hypothetical protein CO040_04140 [Candidatus Pacebacteria bacterium CG_4_9_14_0_2_um_filter_36_8]
MQKKHLILALVLYAVSAIGSFSVFSYVDKSKVVLPGGKNSNTGTDGTTLLGALLEIDPQAPRDQVCPLNGTMYTQLEKDTWETRRPLFVMIENHPEARPQSGLSRADLVFEAVAEGGVTRFGAMFYCAAQIQDITLAPIRSARTYFVDLASGFNLPMYVHVGGANVPGPTDALGQIVDYGWNLQNDINQFSVGYPTFVRDYNRVPGKELATEHTMVTTTEKLWAVALDRDWTNMSPDRKVGRKVVEGSDWKAGYEGWTFEKEAPAAGSVNKISYDFWSGYGDYSVSWEFDSAKDAYARSMGGEKHMDINNDEQIMAKNVVVLFMTEKGPINEKKHMLYGTIGTGKALVFKHGIATEVTWSKKTRTSELELLDSKGKTIELARGLTWFSILATGSDVNY